MGEVGDRLTFFGDEFVYAIREPVERAADLGDHRRAVGRRPGTDLTGRQLLRRLGSPDQRTDQSSPHQFGETDADQQQAETRAAKQQPPAVLAGVQEASAPAYPDDGGGLRAGVDRDELNNPDRRGTAS